MTTIFVYNGIKIGNGSMTCLPHKGDYIKIGSDIYVVNAVMFEQSPFSSPFASEMIAVVYLENTFASTQVNLKYI